MSLEYARQVMTAERDAIQQVCDRLDDRFVAALDAIMASQGRVVTCGMGKAGIVAQKIAATLSSTGSPAFFMHPADALHGDLGMVNEGDVALILSNSGESDEITRLLPCLRRASVKIVSMTADERSTLAVQSDIVLHLGHIEEACPFGLAPTASTTAMLALGDALALSLMRRRGFESRDYAQRHPAGALGRRLMPVESVMRTGEAMAVVGVSTKVVDAILAITRARSGAAAVVDQAGCVVGIFCDGDLRRGLEKGVEFLDSRVDTAMTANCTTATVGTLAGAVLDIMRHRRIAEVPVVDADGKLVGMADMKGIVATL